MSDSKRDDSRDMSYINHNAMMVSRAMREVSLEVRRIKKFR